MNELTISILAMDSYNRGNNAQINLNQILNVPDASVKNTHIGNLTILSNSTSAFGDGVDASISFYGIAYQDTSGAVTISYRGTDNFAGDVTNGWLLGGGNYNVPQGAMAINFYKSVATLIGSSNLQTANISLTGHSLGGGLAGYVASLYGKNANVFDSMNYADAAANAHFYASLSPSNPQYATVAKPLINLIYNGGSPWAVNESHVVAEHIQGEAISYFDPVAFSTTLMHPAAQNAESYTLGANVTGLSAIQLHSAATFIIADYARVGGPGDSALPTDWNASAKYFWPELYNADFIGTYISSGRVPGTMNEAQEWDGILRTILAYSAISEGTTVFGNTGIVALYNDANDLGKAAGPDAQKMPSAITAWGGDIAKAFMQYAGELALNKIALPPKFANSRSGMI